MDELIAQAISIARGMWRRRWVGLFVAWGVAMAGAVFLLRWQDRYEATARVYVDTKSVLKPLLRDLAVDPDVDQTIALLARTLITRPNIELLMKRTGLDQLPREERERTAELFLREIKLMGSGRDNVFTFSYRDPSMERARLIVQNLVSLFVDSDLGSRQRDSEEAKEFIDEQIKNYEVRLAEAETRLKDFKLRNMGVTDVSGRDYFTRMTALTEELAKMSTELRAAEQSRDALRRELDGETMSLLPDLTSPSATISTPELDSRLDAQRRQLDELLRRYTDIHPDVVAARKLIARLEEQKQQEIEAARRRAAAETKSPQTTTNPVFQQVKLALAEAEASVASLRVRVAETQSRVNQLRSSANRVPQVEAELAQLNRDYEVVRRNYEALVGRREKASLSEDVDARRLTQFRVIDPPRTAAKPVFPSRIGLAPMVLVAALLAGLGASFVLSQLMPTFETARSLRNFSRREVLGSVSMIQSPTALRRSRLLTLAFGSGVGTLLLFYGVGMALLAMRLRA
ncbi:XrtA system polysaccharide chain length determinant [uncultured Piscinibacter sp.]|uniref:XrtA system polysaccharide chain length determinant n=1 Tax=uncultured Piscinibacter sp. TaxID=1131835 RepID=UPI00263664E4|nr:XrtA system polysaccharide chain length determinant [uncultured Piscinibacter sp.]